MNDVSRFSELELRLQSTLDALSNREGVEVKDEWVEEAGEAFKAAIRRKLQEGQEPFRLRMSNIGKPLCQLQNEQRGLPGSRKPYNHFMRMLIGDAVESIIRLVAKAAKVNITAEAMPVNLKVNDSVIEGTDDIEIDNKIYDVKSCSPFAFSHKWADGWNSVYHHDSFGYVGQLYGYSRGRNLPMGGWIVVEKSSGEVKVVEAEPTPLELDETQKRLELAERTLTESLPFAKCFEEQAETFRKEPTGNYVVPIVCTFCDFVKHCWPEAVLLPQAKSQAKEPKLVLYSRPPENE